MKAVKFDTERLKGALSRRQTEVAEKIGISLNSLSRKLNGRLRFTIDDLNNVCRVIGREPSEFIIYVEEIEKAA